MKFTELPWPLVMDRSSWVGSRYIGHHVQSAFRVDLFAIVCLLSHSCFPHLRSELLVLYRAKRPYEMLDLIRKRANVFMLNVDHIPLSPREYSIVADAITRCCIDLRPWLLLLRYKRAELMDAADDALIRNYQYLPEFDKWISRTIVHRLRDAGARAAFPRRAKEAEEKLAQLLDERK